MTAQYNPEIGRPLRADELHKKTVVCIRREDRALWLTMWVEFISDNTVVFLAGAVDPRIRLMVFRKSDGTMMDDTGRQMLVHEYLGEV